jgi:hypothetical protein
MFRYGVGAFVGFVFTFFSVLVYFAFGDGTVTPVSKNHYKIFKDFISPVVSGFAGAAAGAICAYAFSVIQQARRDLEQAAEVYVSLMYAVTAMHGDVSAIIRDVVKPSENEKARFLIIPHLGYSLRSYDIDIDKRAFGLFVKLRAVEANSKLFFAVNSYKSLAHQINARRDLMNEYTSKKDNGLGKVSRNSNLHEIASIVGDGLVFNAYEASEGLIRTLEKTRASLMELIDYLKVVGVLYFKGKGVSVFIPEFNSAPLVIAPPGISALEELKLMLGVQPFHPVRISDQNWMVPVLRLEINIR